HVPLYTELLAEQSGRRVSVARQGERIERGRIYVAGNGLHLRIGRLGAHLVALLDGGPEEHHCRPAVDPLFRSAAGTCGSASVGGVVAGMGRDGALGAVALRSRGAPIVVQDEASSVVWGMPGAVVAAGAADVIAPAAEVAGWVARWSQ